MWGNTRETVSGEIIRYTVVITTLVKILGFNSGNKVCSLKSITKFKLVN